MQSLKIKNTHGLTTHQLRLMEKKTKEAFSVKRLAAVRMVMEGRTGSEVASILNLTRQTVSKYVKLFEKGGVELLLHRNIPPGKPAYLSAEEKEQVKEIILTQTPKEMGMDLQHHWNTRNIQQLLWEQLKVWMSREGIRVMLRQMGLRYTRSTYKLVKADIQKQELFEQELNMIKKTC